MFGQILEKVKDHARGGPSNDIVSSFKETVQRVADDLENALESMGMFTLDYRGKDQVRSVSYSIGQFALELASQS